MVYELSLSNGDWKETVFHAFFGDGDGQLPDGGVIVMRRAIFMA